MEKVRGEKGINSQSPEAIYKVMGPDGNIIKDNVNYEEGSRTLREETEKYKQKIES